VKIEGSYRIEVRKDDLARSRVVSAPVKADTGAVIAAVDRFALTANNVTYAVHGEDFGYWRAWPATDDAHGVVPVWGFASIVQGSHEGIRPGQRFWGFWPSASHARLHPADVTEAGFRDTSGGRAEMAPIYTRFAAVPAPARPEEEDLLCLFQPLFGTGFLIDDLIAGQQGAERVVLTSASSKTALAAAWCLKARGGVEVIGLTSLRNSGFVEGTGCYDQVLAYSAVDQLPADAPAVLVDFAGDRRMVKLLHERMRGLAASWIVGDTHWDSGGQDVVPGGPEQTLFFAPSVWADRAQEEGAAALEARMGAARTAFLADAANWMGVRRLEGPQGWTEGFTSLLKSGGNPAEGLIIIP
jgi:hypothetical protein